MMEHKLSQVLAFSILLEQGNLLDGIFVKGFVQLIVGCAIGLVLAFIFDR